MWSIRRSALSPEKWPDLRIPFNRPSFVGRELSYMADSVASGYIGGDGPFTKRCEHLLEEVIGSSRALLTTSCTHALELTASLLDLRPGDEVIVPAYTFVSTASAYASRGAKIVFADIRPDTLNIDEAQIERLVTRRTRAIVVVHYGGIACDMEAIGKIAEQYGISVIEDNAHGLFASYRTQPLGSFGVLATQSFHETKNFTCGEGGALLLNDSDLIERAEILREKGTNRSKFFRGQVDKYTWVDLGSSYVPSDILAAFLLAQLEGRRSIQNRRAKIWARYDESFRDWANNAGVHTPTVPDGCDQAFHMYYLILPSLQHRREFIDHLRRQGILAVFHYQPLNCSPMGVSVGGEPGSCPVAEDIADRLVRLPLFNDLTEDEQLDVIETVLSFGPAR